MLAYIVQLSFSHERCRISTHKEDFIRNFPVDPDTATAKFPLNSTETIHAVCPNSKCHKTYAPSFADNSLIPLYPKFCTHQEFKNGQECRTALTCKQLFSSVNIEVPIKRFVSFSFKAYVAKLLTRSDMEDLIDNPRRASASSGMKDAHDGNFLRHFIHADGTPFVSTSSVGRYCFSLCVDFFNPFTNKQVGKKSSIGIISVVCLNIPITHRYKPENMFLAGVIPGPNEPPLTTSNHYLTPLIDELETLWNPGVMFSMTSKHPEGHLVQCALVLVVCDLPAARKTGGFAAFSHEHFCSVCHCTLSVHGYGNTAYKTWRRRTNQECRDAADQYRNAQNEKTCTKTFDGTGMRWSELLRLPYFDISKCVVVDSMHNLFLGLLKEHFNGILGIGLPIEREQPVIDLNLGEVPTGFRETDKRGLRKLIKLLQAPVVTALPSETEAVRKLMSGVNWKPLEFVCNHLECVPPSATSGAPSKTALASALYAWVSSFSFWFDTG